MSRRAEVNLGRGLHDLLMLRLSRLTVTSWVLRASFDMLHVPQKTADSQDINCGCRFGDAMVACRPNKALQPQTAPDWQWWMVVQSAFHSGDLQKASPAEAHMQH